jgi:ubiquinone/menaquinone biosynthesis C-methylase UbiE
MKELKDIEKARKILGISKSATEDKVKRAYRALVKKWHPDTNRSKEAHDKMQEINLAFQTVMKEDFGKMDVWKDYNMWWFKQFGNDHIWGNYAVEEDKKAISHKHKKGKKTNSYLDSCKTKFWKDIFKEELKYILRELKDCKSILSVGCGPAIIEKGLEEKGFDVTGLDVSKEALEGAPDTIRTFVGSAEDMHFKDSRFDATIYIASLQFIDKFKKAIRETKRVLKPKGKILVMLLNPKSGFFKEKTKQKGSYVNKIKHPYLKQFEEVIFKYFDKIKAEYYLGIKGKRICSSKNPELASLYIIQGRKK